MTRKKFSGFSEQWKASIHRLEDAECLIEAGRWRGAMYLAGYAVECRLKSKLLGILRSRTLAELEKVLEKRGFRTNPYTHNLKVLIDLTQASSRLQQNDGAWHAFKLVNRWLPAWRYDPRPSSREEAKDFLEAVRVVLKWIDANA